MHEEKNQRRDERFRQMYERLALQGKCDSPGGFEYHRVFEEWNLAGRPAALGHFIVMRANWIPGGGLQTLN